MPLPGIDEFGLSAPADEAMPARAMTVERFGDAIEDIYLQSVLGLLVALFGSIAAVLFRILGPRPTRCTARRMRPCVRHAVLPERRVSATKGR